MEFYGKTALRRAPTYLNRDFFQKPHRLPFIADTGEFLIRWLGYFQVSEEVARSLVTVQLPRRFLYALNEEWRKNVDFYKTILLASDTPFQQASEREYHWVRYRFILQNEFSTEPMFAEEFSLEQVYIPLRAYRERPEKEKQNPYDRIDKMVRDVVDLETEICAWLDSNRKDDTLRVISGGPGSGKSSFGKRLAARLAGEGRYVLFIPLYRYDPQADIIAAVGHFLEWHSFLPHKPLDLKNEEEPLVLIFDGLDELASQGQVSREIAENFLRALKEFLRDRNTTELRVRALLSGRELVIQTHANEFRAVPILHVLPYYLPQEEIKPSPDRSRNYHYLDPQKLLAADQREEWWRKYTMAKTYKERPMPEALKQEALEEISAQPLLNYLVALSYQRGKINFTEEQNLNAIYADLLKSVHEKQWGGGMEDAVGDTILLLWRGAAQDEGFPHIHAHERFKNHGGT